MSLSSWVMPGHNVPAKVYLDASIYEAFVEWIVDASKSHPFVASNIHAQIWRIYVFRYQLNRAYGSMPKRDSLLKELGINIVDARHAGSITGGDEFFVNEVLRVYFENNAAYRRQAELLLLARRHAGDDWVTIISQHHGFEKIPMANIYYLDIIPRMGNSGLPAYFDFFVDMKIHRRVLAVAESRLRNNDAPTALIESAKEIYERLQILSGTHEMDGTSIADFALDCPKWPKTEAGKPRVKLVEVDSSLAWNYQKGFHEMVSGLSRALRNPIAHRPVDKKFIREKYGDEVTALKLLCLISFILEKLDSPVT